MGFTDKIVDFFSTLGIKSNVEKWGDEINLRDVDYSDIRRIYMKG
jgi:hypothetical protein